MCIESCIQGLAQLYMCVINAPSGLWRAPGVWYSWAPFSEIHQWHLRCQGISLTLQVFASASPEHPEKPWIVFTAGPMGVGKGHVLRYLEQMGVLNLQDFVQSLPDWFREQFPEYDGYVAYNNQMAGIFLWPSGLGLYSCVYWGPCVDHLAQTWWGEGLFCSTPSKEIL